MRLIFFFFFEKDLKSAEDWKWTACEFHIYDIGLLK